MQVFPLCDSNPYYNVLLRIARNLEEMRDVDFARAEVEILLFYAMRGHKPVGLFRHFMMLLLHLKFTTLLKKELPSTNIWNHLEDSLYDLTTLHESESMAYPHERVEGDYDIDEDWKPKDSLIETMEKPNDEGNEKPLNESSNNKNVKKANTSKSKQNSSAAVSSKNTFATPDSNKLKQSSKNANLTDINIKKPESSLASKLSKIKRSSSPSTSRSSTADSSSREGSTEPPAKKIKNEANTPTSSKKTVKTESNSSAKKSAKQEQTPKHNKVDSSETPNRKGKNDKEVLKKGKVSSTHDSSLAKRNSHVENKKSDFEPSKRSNEATGKFKTDRASSVSSRGSKQEDSDSSVASGSRKSSTSSKNDSNDKKKKKTSPVKRRRN